jgi:hypothetical protein
VRPLLLPHAALADNDTLPSNVELRREVLEMLGSAGHE